MRIRDFKNAYLEIFSEVRVNALSFRATSIKRAQTKCRCKRTTFLASDVFAKFVDKTLVVSESRSCTLVRSNLDDLFAKVVSIPI